MSKVFTDINFSNDNFPFMTFKTFDYKNSTARIMRASFTGELGYEIYVSPIYALDLWKEIFKHGKSHQLVPYGRTPIPNVTSKVLHRLRNICDLP